MSMMSSSASSDWMFEVMRISLLATRATSRRSFSALASAFGPVAMHGMSWGRGETRPGLRTGCS